MTARRSRFLGDPQAAPKTPPKPRKPHILEYYTVYWKNPEDKTKGTIWVYHSIELLKKGGVNGDPDIPFRNHGHRPSLTKARGKKWTATFEDGEEHLFLASPMGSKRVIASIVARWPRPPIRLQPDKGPPFSLETLQDELHCHVYLVRLTTFHQTSQGQYYYKIGKAKSIPKRIKQFGPCELLASIDLTNEKESLRVEAELHTMFNHFRRPETEIFCMSEADLEVVLHEYSLRNGSFLP